jgi:hypothetical protein
LKLWFGWGVPWVAQGLNCSSALAFDKICLLVAGLACCVASVVAYFVAGE